MRTSAGTELAPIDFLQNDNQVLLRRAVTTSNFTQNPKSQIYVLPLECSLKKQPPNSVYSWIPSARNTPRFNSIQALPNHKALTIEVLDSPEDKRCGDNGSDYTGMEGKIQMDSFCVSVVFTDL